TLRGMAPMNEVRAKLWKSIGPECVLGVVWFPCNNRAGFCSVFPPQYSTLVEYTRHEIEDENCSGDQSGDTAMSTATRPAGAVLGRGGFQKEEKKVIFASSLGTVFEWYDFYLYATLAPFFAALFFPSGNDTEQMLSSFATSSA